MRKETVYRIFSHIPTLETPRLTLRGMRVSDAEDVFDYASRDGKTFHNSCRKVEIKLKNA